MLKKYHNSDVIGWHEIPSLHIRLLHYFAFLKAGMTFPCFSFNTVGEKSQLLIILMQMWPSFIWC